MGEIRYDHVTSSTFSSVLLAAMVGLASTHALAEQTSKRPSRVVYQADSHASTYSHVIGPNWWEGLGCGSSETKRPWLTADVKEFLYHSPRISPEAVDHLRGLIHSIYGEVRIDTALHSDPEEEWVKPVFTVYSGVDDFDRLMDLEDRFFAQATEDSILHGLLPFVVVSQA